MVFFFFWLTKTIAENKNMFLNKAFRIFLGNLTRFLRQALPRLAPANLRARLAVASILRMKNRERCYCSCYFRNLQLPVSFLFSWRAQKEKEQNKEEEKVR